MSKIDKAKMWMSNKALIQSKLRYGSIIRIYHKNSEKKEKKNICRWKIIKKI